VTDLYMRGLSYYSASITIYILLYERIIKDVINSLILIIFFSLKLIFRTVNCMI